MGDALFLMACEGNSSALRFAMLERQVPELTNHREACSIRAGLAVIGQKYNGENSDLAVVWGEERGLKNRPEMEPKYYVKQRVMASM